MKTGLANQKLDAIIANVEKGGVTASNLVEDLKALREMALLEQDPHFSTSELLKMSTRRLAG